jgi:curli biogenesis system outer membrane secretion channel CsgG
MKLVKTNEQVDRRFVDGKKQEVVTGANYEVKDAAGASVGNVNVYQGGFSINVTGCASVEESDRLVATMFAAIEMPETGEDAQ